MTDDRPEFDAARLLADLERSAAEIAVVATYRPTGVEMARVVRQLANLLESIFRSGNNDACAARRVSPKDNFAWQSAPGSRAAADIDYVDVLIGGFLRAAPRETLEFAETNPSRNSVVWGIEMLDLCIRTIVDHLRGLADVMVAGTAFRSGLTLERTIVETAALTRYLTDLEIDPRERLRRCHNLRLESVQEGANHGQADDSASDYKAQIHVLAEFGRHCGFRVSKPKRPHVAPELRGEPQRPTSIRELIEEVLPGIGKSIYRTLSSVAHCRPFTGDVLPDDYGGLSGSSEWQLTQKLCFYLIPGLLVIRDLAPQVCGYLGWDHQEFATSADLVLRMAQAGAGWFDNEVRVKLGYAPIPD